TQALSLHERHGEPEVIARGAGVENCEDVGMLQVGGEADLSLEPFRSKCRRKVRVEHLERHQAVVLEVTSEEYGGHAPATELALEYVAAAQPTLEQRLQV